jgi:hypothetical protein
LFQKYIWYNLGQVASQGPLAAVYQNMAKNDQFELQIWIDFVVCFFFFRILKVLRHDLRRATRFWFGGVGFFFLVGEDDVVCR